MASADHPSFVQYKLDKAVHDYGRAHDILLGWCPDHYNVKARDEDITPLRYAADDLLADVIAAWDELLREAANRAQVGPGNAKKVVLQIEAAMPSANRLMTKGWDVVVRSVNGARNQMQHEDFWKNTLAFGQGGGPFALDLQVTTGLIESPKICLMRDVRRTIDAIDEVSRAYLGRPMKPTLRPRCADCWEDDWTIEGHADALS
jgi:hypothetical protein